MTDYVNFDNNKDKQYDADFEFAFRFTRWLLYLSTSWPVHRQNLILYIFVRFFNFIFVSMLTSVIVSPMFLNPIVLCQDLSQKIKDLSLMIICAGYIIRYIIFACNSKTFRDCIRNVFRYF